VKHFAEAITEASLNVRVAEVLSEKLLNGKDAEIANLEREKANTEREVERLKLQLKEPRHDVRTKRTQLAQQKDRVSKQGAQIDSCREWREKVMQTLNDARSQYSSMAGLNEYGLSMRDEDVTQKAQQLSQEAYGDLNLFPSSQPPNEPPAEDAGALKLLPADLQAVIQQLMEEQRKTLIMQFKADMEVRGKGSGSSTSLGSQSDGRDTLLSSNSGSTGGD